MHLGISWTRKYAQQIWQSIYLFLMLWGWFNKKMPSYQYRKSHCGDKTILRPSYLHNGISYTGKMTSLNWIGALGLYVPRAAMMFMMQNSPISRRWTRMCLVQFNCLAVSHVCGYIHVRQWDVMTHSCLNFDGGSVEPPLKSWHGWVIFVNLWFLG